MNGTWQQLRSILSEAKSAADFAEDVFRYMTRRYGEHASDELRNKMKSIPFKDFKKYAAVEYFDSKLDSLIDDMAITAINARRAKQGSGPEKMPGSTQGPSGRAYMDPGDAEERQAKIDAMRQARNQSRTGGQDAMKALMTPGQGGGHAMGSAGQHQPKQQPSLAAGVHAQRNDPHAKPPKSGLVKAQRDVDKVTKDKGAAAGEKLARELGVPSTADRTTVHPDTGVKTVQIWSPDRVFKHMDTDRNPDARSKTDAEKRAQSSQRAKSAAAGSIDPDRVEKIKQGILQRNAAPTKLGPTRPGSFHGERWKPHGRETQVAMSRPDAATGNWTRGKVSVNPKHTGAESVWNQHDNEWQLPSVFASREAERGARMKASQTPAANTDFDSDEKTDPDLEPFRG